MSYNISFDDLIDYDDDDNSTLPSTKAMNAAARRQGMAWSTSASKGATTMPQETTVTSMASFLQGVNNYKDTSISTKQQEKLISKTLSGSLIDGQNSDKKIGDGYTEFVPSDIKKEADGVLSGATLGGATSDAGAAGVAGETGGLSTSADVSGAGGDLVEVKLNGATMKFARSFAAKVVPMIEAAAKDGVILKGGGWRSAQRQIELRKEHCGSSHYAIYEMPSGSCRPPTAIPGTSNHEKGLAFDVENCGKGSAAYNWLVAHAHEYEVINFKKESWHWSDDGG